MRNFQGEEPSFGLGRAADVPPQRRRPATHARVAQHRKQQPVGSGDKRSHADVSEHTLEEMEETDLVPVRAYKEPARKAQRNQSEFNTAPGKPQNQRVESKSAGNAGADQRVGGWHYAQQGKRA